VLGGTDGWDSRMNGYEPDLDAGKPLLDVDDLKVWFPIRKGVLQRTIGHVQAVDGVSFAIRRGETLGLVGESGSGKTTTGRAIVRLEKPTAGSVLFDGVDLAKVNGSTLRRERRRFQMVFQDPYSSLDPRQTIGGALREALRMRNRDVQGADAHASKDEQVAQLLGTVGLRADAARRYPHQFSGGQRQRISIARALAVGPDLLVCDEPVSSLDVSIQAQIINLLARLQEELGLSYLMISHDLAIVRHIADHVAVMYLGRIAEIGPAERIYANPTHPYTRALMSAVPVPDVDVERSKRRLPVVGDMPSPSNPPTGCRFHTRCWLRIELGKPDICHREDPALRVIEQRPGGSHFAACHFAEPTAAGNTSDLTMTGTTPVLESTSPMSTKSKGPSAIPSIERTSQPGGQ
jgi:peptide/nickel transport system ATP-binding protein